MVSFYDIVILGCTNLNTQQSIIFNPAYLYLITCLIKREIIYLNHIVTRLKIQIDSLSTVSTTNKYKLESFFS